MHLFLNDTERVVEIGSDSGIEAFRLRSFWEKSRCLDLTARVVGEGEQKLLVLNFGRTASNKPRQFTVKLKKDVFSEPAAELLAFASECAKESSRGAEGPYCCLGAPLSNNHYKVFIAPGLCRECRNRLYSTKELESFICDSCAAQCEHHLTVGKDHDICGNCSRVVMPRFESCRTLEEARKHLAGILMTENHYPFQRERMIYSFITAQGDGMGPVLWGDFINFIPEDNVPPMSFPDSHTLIEVPSDFIEWADQKKDIILKMISESGMSMGIEEVGTEIHTLMNAANHRGKGIALVSALWERVSPYVPIPCLDWVHDVSDVQMGRYLQIFMSEMSLDVRRIAHSPVLSNLQRWHVLDNMSQKITDPVMRMVFLDRASRLLNFMR